MSYDSEDEDEAGKREFCSFDGQINSFTALLTLPIAYGVCHGLKGLAMSHWYLFTGEADMEGFRRGSLRYAVGVDLGAMWLTRGEAGGPTLVPHLEILRTLKPGHHLGLRAAFAMAGEAVGHDYARTAFVNGLPIGDEIDRVADYDTHAVPVTLEYHWTSDAGLALTVGAGAAWVRERLDYLRIWTYKHGDRSATEERHRVRPTASLALGRFASRRDGVWSRFALRYQAIWLNPERRSSFPGDNAEMRHSLTWDWSWLP
jgi:hypothetical protein